MRSFFFFWAILDPQVRKFAAGLVVLMVFAAMAEALGIGLVVPLLQVLSDEKRIMATPWLESIWSTLDRPSPERFVLYCMAALAGAYILKGILTISISYGNYTATYRASSRLSVLMYRNYIHCPYTFHLGTNSATLMRNVIQLPIDICATIFSPVIVMAAETLVVLGVVSVLLIYDPVITLVAGGTLGLIGVSYFLLVRKHLQGWGTTNVHLARERLLWTNQAMSAIKEIKVSGSEDFVSRRFTAINDAWARVKAISSVVGEMPRPTMEVAVILMVVLGCMALVGNGYKTADLLGVLGLYGVAAMRLLPSLSRITFNMGNFRFNAAALETIRHDIEMFASTAVLSEAAAGEPIQFKKEIGIQGLSYRYPNTDATALDRVDLSIARGSTVAFVGTSGAGKTTLTNVLIGLLPPTSGIVAVDGQPVDCRTRAWRSKIGYIPQDIYILDDTVRRNVAFGLDDSEIDDNQVWRALTLASLDATIKAQPQQLDAMLGERGARLSGGQRQRIAIARALYRDPEILVLDEATSALDTATEAEINLVVQGLSGSKTVIIVAHRLSTVKEVDCLFFFEAGKLKASGTFQQLEQDSAEFRRVVLGAN